MHVPSETQWGNWQDDLDTAYAHRVLNGKTLDEVAALFAENPIEVAESLQFTPCQVAVFYLQGCISYLSSDASKGHPDAASSFLRLIAEMVRTCPRGVFSPVAPFLESLRLIAERQSFYDADTKIYGSFLDRFRDIKAALEKTAP